MMSTESFAHGTFPQARPVMLPPLPFRFGVTLFAISLFVGPSSPAVAEVRLPNVFADHMVLQQERPIRVFGWADAGEKIVVTFGDASAEATAAANGRWRVDLPAQKANATGQTLTVSGLNTIELKDVLVGEVWICSGQSNMEWPLRASLNSDAEIKAADHPLIRLFDVPKHIAKATAQPDTPGTWHVCSPDSIRDFSAVGYFFGRELQQKVGVPVGLIGTNWGGTRIEPWTPLVGFEKVPQLSDYAQKVRLLDPTTEEGRRHQSEFITEVEEWTQRARAALSRGEDIERLPQRQDHRSVNGATTIYNGMVHGLAPLSVRGAIWYQGESNAGDGLQYAHKKKALIAGWRTVFEHEDLTFYWVQLANFQAPSDDPAGGGWGPVREGQRLALSVPKTGMAVTIDIGDAGDIHPRNKQDVGLRLSRWALRDHYGQQDLVPTGPLFRGMKQEGDKIRIEFDHVGSGLMVATKSGLEAAQEIPDGALRRFAIAGADNKWHWANARIDGESVLVWSEDVKEPKAVRYGFESNPTGANLYNREGLPASPFSTDTKL